MKRVIIGLLLFFTIPIIVLAQVNDFNSYSSIDADFKVSSTVDVISGPEGYIESYIARSNIRAINDSIRQVVLSENYAAVPKGVQVSQVNDSIQFEWDSKNSNVFQFEILSKVRVFNQFIKVKNRINFPPDNLPLIVQPYTHATQFIDINPEIRAKANELVEGETDYYRAIFSIGDWVENNINYSLDTLTEDALQKSSWVIQNKYGVCDELTNLFISMLRSVGIPARFVSGQAYSNVLDNFGNHGWAEVYFPGYGWIPFDITFKQLGWVDPSHIKMRDQLDSGEPSIEYYWRSRDVEFKTSNVSVETDTTKLIPREGRMANISVEVLHKKAGPGSFVPIFVKIKNPYDYYLPIAVFIRKSPELTTKNSITILLEPFGERNLFWITKIPDDFDKDFLYTSTIEVGDTYGDIATTELDYGADFEIYSQENAEEEAALLSPIPKREFLPDINFNCSFGKDAFFENEPVFANCVIENVGNTMISDVKVCLQDNCKYAALNIEEKTIVSFEFNPSTLSIGKKRFSAESARLIKYDYTDLKLIEDPQLRLADYGPKSFPYGDKENITLHFVSKSKAYDISIEIYGNTIVELNELSGKDAVILNFDTKDLPSDIVKVKIKYKDEGKREFVALDKEIAKVYDRPFYALLLYHFRKTFGMF